MRDGGVIVTSPGSPPAAESAAAEPGITEEARADAAPEAPEARAAPNGATARPVTLVTQELRLAMVVTGGVSLAIWMGGVMREVNLLAQASERRQETNADAAPDTSASTADDVVRNLYQRLLDLLDVRITVDVLAGTSAGGINAALLGLATARRLDLAPLRDIWLKAGAFDRLLRDPREQDPPSLLRGDGQLLEALRGGIETILGGSPPPENPRPTDVFITTTLLSPEMSRFTDDYGTTIADSDHHGLFRFDQYQLCDPAIVGPLALAARSSASFPAAFEPAFAPFGGEVDNRHPDMRAFANTTRAHWVADGGLLVNRPIGPLLQTVFDRPADRQVRRALLYVVPSSAAPRPPDPDAFDAPLKLGEALLRDLGATLNQSIAADLATIRDHNDRVASIGSIRLHLARIGAQAARVSGPPLAGRDTWAVYRRRQGEWLVRPLITEIMRQLDAVVPSPWPSALSPGSETELGLRRTAQIAVTEGWPDATPGQGDDAEQSAAALGRSAFDAAKASVLDLLRSGYVLADSDVDREQLARLGSRAHQAFAGARDTDLRAYVAAQLKERSARAQPLDTAVREIAKDYAKLQGEPDALKSAWSKLAGVVADARPILGGLLASFQQAQALAAERTAIGAASLRERRVQAASWVETYLDYLGQDTSKVARALLDLHVAERALLPVGVDVEQRVELIQVSADTRSLLAPRRSTAASKLTGMQLHHFGAFYKGSWRANDWMWGRLDGVGWLVHVLLDPRRILAVLEMDRIRIDQRAKEFYRRLAEVVGEPEPAVGSDAISKKDLLEDLAFLDNEAAPMPPSLPRVALWAALAFQRHIAEAELASVAAQVRVPEAGAPQKAARAWLDQYDAAARIPNPPERVRAVAATLPACPVPDERLSEETREPLFLRTASQTAAVATAAATALRRPPQSLRPAFATARSITLTAYVATDRTSGSRRAVLLTGLVLMIIGVLAMATNTVWLGLPGLVLFGAGVLMAAFVVWRSVPRITLTVLTFAILLLAAAPWLPWLRTTVFGWLTATAVPYMRDNKWPWTAFFLLVLLPPLTMLGSIMFRRRSPAGPPQAP